MREYKFIDGGKDKKIAYPGDMSNELVTALEKARVNESFVTLSVGDMKTGESWGDLYDNKGIIGLSRGRDYLYPILVSFKRGAYDEENDIVIGEDYSDLCELSTKEIAEYLDKNDLSLDDVLDSGGGIISSVVAVQTGIKKNKVSYRHPLFKGIDFSEDNIEIKTETLTKTCETVSSLTKEVKTVESIESYFVLFLGGELYSRHSSKKDLKKFLEANRQINLC